MHGRGLRKNRRKRVIGPMKGSERGEGRLGARGGGGVRAKIDGRAATSAFRTVPLRVKCGIGGRLRRTSTRRLHARQARFHAFVPSALATVKRSATLEKINGDDSGATAAATLDCTATFAPATLGPTNTSTLQPGLFCCCLDLDFTRPLAGTIGDMADLETVTLGRSRRSTAGNRYD